MKNNTAEEGHIYPEELTKQYLKHLLDANRHDAINLILKEVKNGLPLKSVYLKVIQPAMYEVGRLWQVNEIDIAVEHFCSASTQLLMAQLFPYVLSGNTSDYKMVGSCLGSELHEIGMRVVCDFFEIEGWDTYFTGAITPDNSLLRLIETQKPDILCLSCTMNFGVHQARDVINKIRNSRDLNNVRIMVGGLPFIINPDLYKVVGADATAKDAQHAVDEAYKLLK